MAAWNLKKIRAHTTYPKTKAYHLHLDKIRVKVFRVIFTGGTFPALATRSTESSHSFWVKNHARVVYGVSGRKKNVAKPTGTVIHFQEKSDQLHGFLDRITKKRGWLSYTANNIQPPPSCQSMMTI